MAAAVSVRAVGPAYMVKNINTGPDPEMGSNAAGFADIGSAVLFVATDDTGIQKLWRTDGTPARTLLVKDIAASPGVAFGNLYYFHGPDGLYRSDGTAPGTFRVADVPAQPVIAVGHTLYLRDYEYENGDDCYGHWRLWASDGTAQGTGRIAEFDIDGNDPGFTGIGPALFFAAAGPAGNGLWVTDGTTAGTVLVKSGWVEDLFPVGDTLFFTIPIYSEDTRSVELWRSDGTPLGTKLVTALDSWPTFTALGGQLFFLTTGDGSVTELWGSDGTEVGTYLVVSIDSPLASGLAAANGHLVFATHNGTHNLWTSDGTAAGTTLLAEVVSALYYWVGPLVTVGDAIFVGIPHEPNRELWKTDGTDGGTVLVRAFTAVDIFATPRGAFLLADDGKIGNEPWFSDGTAAGTRPLANIFVGEGGSNPRELTDLNGTLCFGADDSIHGDELWRSDGTEGGTALVADINPGSDGSTPDGAVVAGGVLYFAADDGQHGRELWRTDGTAASTVLVSDINQGAAGSYPTYITDLGGFVLFGTEPDGGGSALWRSNGRPDGTVKLAAVEIAAPPAVASGQLFFFTRAGYDQALWESDGTRQGTFVVQSGFGPGEVASAANTLFSAVGSNLFGQCEELGPMFASRDSENWTISELAETGGRLLFAERKFYSSLEQLWTSDGTAAGTLDLQDFADSWDYHYPHIQFITASGSHAFFSVYQATANRELWALPLAAVSPVNPDTCPVGSPRGDCCSAHPGPGCNSDACQSCVCALDGACCGGTWDQTCVGEANVQCRDNCPCLATGDCCSAHDTPSCDDFACRSCVCSINSECCSVVWDQSCAEAAATECGTGCGCAERRNCCTVHDSAGCDDTTCRSCVCNLDSQCCSGVWDQTCTDEAAVECKAACACATGGDCCADHAPDAGCAEPSCEACVCAIDATCCGAVSGWSADCVAKANADCAAICPCTPKGSCLEAQADTVGCENSRCQLCVCNFDPPCCFGVWDAYCAAEAANECHDRCDDDRVRCAGDCNYDRMVTIDELVTGINIALGNQRLHACPAVDCKHSGTVSIDCLVQSTDGALNGCAAGSAQP